MTSARFTEPTYDRGKLKPRILHVGFGAFARAHLAVYLDETLAARGGDWGLCAARLHSGAQELAELESANCLYRVAEADDHGTLVRTIGAVTSTLHPSTADADRLFARFVDGDLSIVSLTVTEKGYCTDGSGHLDLHNESIRRDLDNPEACGTAVGFIVKGLARRRKAGLGGLSVLSCDNLPNNGAVAKNVVLEFAEQWDPDLAGWITKHVTFPSTMVDRIVPALTGEARSLIEDLAGESSRNDIVCEPFRQWVIEDDFAAGRPDFDVAGAQFVADVGPFEDMKLRMLNGSHSFLAYLGALAGHETVSDCMADAALSAAARDLMLLEQKPTLSMPEGTDLDAYADDLIERFSNSRLKHKTTQIASDGSQKLPQRMLNSIRHHLEKGTPWRRLAFGIAGWMAYARGADEAGNPLPLNDPLAERIQTIAVTADGPDYVTAMLQLEAVFPADLAGNPEFRKQIITAYENLRRDGVRSALANLQEAT